MTSWRTCGRRILCFAPFIREPFASSVVMNTTQDEDERRKRSVEAGREMITEGISSRDITHSGVSISEGEADADLEGLAGVAGRVAELEELLQGKEAVVGSLNAEIDHLRAETSSPNSSQSQSSSIHGRDIISLCHVKLQEFEKAINERDYHLIEYLTSSLEQALGARDSVTAQLNALNSMQFNNPAINNVNLQQKIEVLETVMNDKEALIHQLNTHLTDIHKHVQMMEMEKETRNAEINDYKIQINNLNEQIRLGATEKNLNIDETLEQQKQYEARIEKIKQNHQEELKEERKLNEELRDTVQTLQKELEDASMQRSQDNSDIKDMVQRKLNLSARLDKQLMQVINNDKVDGTVNEDHYQKTSDLISKNDDLLRKLEDHLEVKQDIIRHQIVKHDDRILQLKAHLTEETKKVVKLDKELMPERNAVKFLRMQLEQHRRMADIGLTQKTELIEFLQTKLISSLENEEKLRNDLTSMREQQINLDLQLTSMRKLIEIENASRKQNFAATVQNESERMNENLEDSCDNSAELRENIKKLENEMSKYEKQLEIAMKEQERLISSLALTNGLKEILEMDLRRTTDELKAREEDCNYLQKQLKMLTESKKQNQDAELDEIKELRKEIDIAREVRMELEADINRAKQDLKESSNRELKLSRTIDSLKERETEFNLKLAFSKDKERELKDLIETVKVIPANFMQKCKEQSETIEKYAIEKNNFEEKIGKLRLDRELLTQRVKLLEGQLKKVKTTQSSSQPVSIERLQNFYGKYLRVESRWKALAYQKKYLLCIVGSYQKCNNNTLCRLAQLSRVERSYTRSAPYNKKVRFRIAVFAIVSIHKMKWLNQRWRTRKHMGANAIMDGGD